MLLGKNTQIRRVRQGKGTGILFDSLSPGDEIGLDGPYGVAFLRANSPRDIVCVAGGSGLAPMLSITRGAVEAGLLGELKQTSLKSHRILCKPIASKA